MRATGYIVQSAQSLAFAVHYFGRANVVIIPCFFFVVAVLLADRFPVCACCLEVRVVESLPQPVALAGVVSEVVLAQPQPLPQPLSVDVLFYSFSY
jgi:hypothetical protein